MKNLITFILVAMVFNVTITLQGCTKVNRYVGVVQSVSSWDGSAMMVSKGNNGKDTVIRVIPLHQQIFQAGETLTVWTGGDLINDATTNPQ